MAAWKYRNLTAAATVIVAGPDVTLIAVIVNTAAAASTVTVFDGANTTTTALATVATIDSTATGNFFYGCDCERGITVTVAGGAPNVTVVYDQFPPWEEPDDGNAV
jgi:hypothetical protein